MDLSIELTVRAAARHLDAIDAGARPDRDATEALFRDLVVLLTERKECPDCPFVTSGSSWWERA